MAMSPSKMSPPLLLLPPVCGEPPRFYSLAKKRVVKILWKRQDDDDGAQFVGSSHGWIALFERRSKRIILWNPLNGVQIKLPPLESLRGLPHSSLWVTKVVLSSSSPEGKACRAVMISCPGDTLQFCSPAIDFKKAWTPIGDLLISSERIGDREGVHRDIDFSNSCEDVVYSEVQDAFYTIKPCKFRLDTLIYVVKVDTWARDLSAEAAAARKAYFYLNKDCSDKEVEVGKTLGWVMTNRSMLKDQCVQIPHIVVFEKETYIAVQFVRLMKSENEAVARVPLCPFRGLGGYFHAETCGFVVFKLSTTTTTTTTQEEEDGTMEIVDDLGGLAMFVGLNSSIAVRASDFDGLDEDSIYFADFKRIKRIYGRKDNGCFDYRNKAVTPFAIDEDYEVGGGKSLYYYEDKLKSSPIWFFPPPAAAEII